MTNFNNLLRSLLQFAPDQQFAMERVMDELAAWFHADTVTLHLLDPISGMLVMKAQKGLPKHIEEITQRIPLGKGIAGEAAQTGRAVTTCNLQTDASGVARPAAKATGVGGALCVPVYRNGQLAGTLGVGTRREYTYTKEQTVALANAGNTIVTALG